MCPAVQKASFFTRVECLKTPQSAGLSSSVRNWDQMVTLMEYPGILEDSPSHTPPLLFSEGFIDLKKLWKLCLMHWSDKKR